MKPGTPPLKSTRLLDQVCEHDRYVLCSFSIVKIYLYWVQFFIRWHGRDGQMQHPRHIGASGVESFLTMLAKERKFLHPPTVTPWVLFCFYTLRF